MKTVPLGRTGLTVSALCLGTMTWGSHNTEAEGHAQADLALERGITFWDTAEIYPVAPIRAETVGRTEEIIGTWLAARGGRDRLVIATGRHANGPSPRRDPSSARSPRHRSPDEALHEVPRNRRTARGRGQGID